MMQSLLSFKSLAGLLLARLAIAAPTSQELESRASTCNTATNRGCWTDGFDINTDYEQSTPAGGSVSYNWEITEIDNWVGPDGVAKGFVQLVNGQFPGPTLRANWGDTITVTITNKMAVNGTSIHWHGLRQFETNLQDGVNGVTDCPIPPGSSKTYTLKATQYGTSWYHSHFSAQYGNGVWGPIHIDGPASANYDIDLGVFPIGDYYYKSADAIVAAGGAPPPSDNLLFNGTNINPLDTTKGKYATVTLTPGSVHRLRIVNPSSENNYQISLVGHNFTIIQTDFVPIEPVVVDNIYVAIGQRYDILINATQSVDNYWFNATMFANSGCGTSVNTKPAAVFQYKGVTSGLPTNTGVVPANANCRDSTGYTPVVTRTADETTLLVEAVDPSHQININSNFTAPLVWSINTSSVTVQWDKPVIQYVLEGNTSYPRSENLIFVDDANVWTYWVVQNLSPVAHPMHIHGHDFLILGSSAGAATFTTSDSSSLKYNNPARRDVTMVAANGWLVIAFLSDNPGNWLFHCHIAWHVSGGLAADFMERRSEQVALISSAELTSFQDTCAAWTAWIPNAPRQPDSGI